MYRLSRYILKLLINLLFVVFFCEFLIYYIVIYQCDFDLLIEERTEDGLKGILIADTHMLGPFRGHPVDKLRREWQMKRSFQTAVQIFQPDVVFILGDVFDEGNWVNDTQFQEYVDRFHTIFYVPENTKIYPIQGNHDINFHYAMHPHLVNRFNNAFNVSGVRLITERKITKTGDRIAVNFVTINSMALEGDGCYLCNQARSELRSIARDFEYEKARDLYSAPFVLQHFPTFRTSDENCIEKNSENNVKYREKWETLSKEASDYIAKVLKPRAYFSGHTHHYCAHKNEDDIFEFTVASFNWRNINNPSFLLGVFTPTNFSISKCDMPKEMTVIICYVIGCLLSLILATRKYSIFITKRNTAKME